MFKNLPTSARVRCGNRISYPKDAWTKRTASLCSAIIVLLSGSAASFAANTAIVGGANLSTTGVGSGYAYGSHGSVVLSGDDDYCGADNVIGRSNVTSGITAAEQYQRFLTNQAFNGYRPYGTSTSQTTWTGDGTTTNNVGYQGTPTGGRINAMPTAFGSYAFATGCGSYASGNYSTAFGSNATATGAGAQAFGVSSLASGIGSIAFGMGSEASADSAIAMGSLSVAKGEASSAFGYKAQATSAKALALGYSSFAGGVGSVAIGGNATAGANASGTNSIAVGGQSVSSGVSSIAVGSGSSATGDSSIAIGVGNIVSGKQSGAIGDPTTITGDGSYSLGNDNTINANNAGTFGNNNSIAATATGSRIIGNSGSITTTDGFVLGNSASVSAAGGVAIGSNSVASVASGIVGYDPLTNSASTITGGVWVSSQGAVSIGNGSSVSRQLTGLAAGTSDTDAVNVAQLKQLRQYASQGWNLSAGGSNATNVGLNETVDLKAGSSNLTVSKVADSNDVTFDLAKNITVDSVTAGDSVLNTNGLTITGGPSITKTGIDADDKKVTSVASGTLSADSTDAVNGSQLFDTNTNVTALSTRVTSVATNTSTYLGGGADVAAGTAPTYTIQGTDYNNVGSALGGVNTSLTSLNTSVTGLNNNALLWDTTAGAFSAKHGTDTKTNSKITNVAAGTLSDTSTDVVNGSQLYTTNTKVDNLSDRAVTYDGAVGGAKDTITLAGGTTGTKITNLKAGTLSASSTDAVNGSQLFDTNTNVTALSTRVTSVATNTSTYLGGGADVAAGTAPTYTIQGTDYNNVGSALGGVNTSLTSLNTSVTGLNNNALLWDTTAGAFSAKRGTDTKTNSKITNVAAGTLSDTSTDVVNGSQLYTTNTKVDNLSDRAVTYDGAVGGAKDTITLAGGTTGTKITNLKAGTLSASSTDAVNGSQLFDTNTTVSTLSTRVTSIATNTSTYLGGGADVAAGTAPTYTIQGTDYNNVGSALGGVNTSLTNLSGKITGLTGDVIAWDSTAGAYSAKHDDGTGTKTNSKITNLAAGTLSDTSTDAVNGSQLFDTNTNVTALSTRVTSVATNTSTYLGGGADVAAGTAPKYTIQGTDYNNVGSALGGVNTSLTSLNTSVTGLNNNALLWDTTAGAFSAKHGTDTKTNSKITNVAAGTLSDTSTDVVNGSQLYTTNTKVDNLSDRAVTYDGAVGGAKDTITLAGGTTGTKLTNLKAGTLSNTSTDAVNGAQLFETNTTVSTLSTRVTSIATNTSTYLGGGADVATGTAPTYTIQGTDYNNVGSALGGVNTSLTSLNSKITGLTGDVLTWDSTAGAYSAKHDDGTGTKTNSKITNVAAGTLSDTSTDVVNGSQLYSTNTKINTIATNTSTYLGGGADVAAGTAPKYTIQGSDYNNIGTAFGGVDTALTNLTVGKSGMVLQENSTAPIYIGSKSGGSVISVAGTDGNRKISGVKAGTAADDAVNVAQMEGGLAAIANNVSDLGRAAIVYDKVDGVNDYNNVTLGGSYGQGPVHMKNVAAGELSETSLDAINGSQLYATNNTISTIATNTSTYLGGGANVANGTAPKYTVQGSDYSDVGSAFSGVDSSLTSISSKISGLSNDALSWDSTAGAYSAKHDDGKGNKTNSKIKYLEDGLIADGSTEAVTGNQIYAMNTQIAAYFGGGAGFANGAWTAPSYNIYNVDSSGKVTTSTYNNVGDALGGVNDSINNVNNRVNDVEDTLNNFKPVDENALQWNDTEGGYDAGGKNNQPNKIVNVADGNIAQGSKDAVNGGQLWDTNKRVDNIEASVGDIADGAAMYDKDSNGNKTNSLTLQGGDASKPVTIANVADGKIETGSKEAVNGGQLHDYTQAQMTTVLDQSKSYTDQRVDNIVSDAVEQSNQYTDMRFGELNYGIHEAKREARQAAAIGLAASSLRFDDNPGKVSVAFGSGFWRSEGAVAMGAGYTSEDGKIRSNLSATSAGGNWGVGAGLSFTLN